MKNIFLTLSVCALFTLTSCKKDHVCSCTSSSTVPGSTSTTSEVTIVKAKKGDAKKACIKTTNTYDFGGTSYTSTMDCKLK
jgi:hypothetical protein